MTIHDLDTIAISPRVRDTWAAYASLAATELLNAGIKPSDIPDEQFRQLPDGSGELFIRIGEKEIKLAVPADEWQFIKQS